MSGYAIANPTWLSRVFVILITKQDTAGSQVSENQIAIT